MDSEFGAFNYVFSSKHILKSRKDEGLLLYKKICNNDYHIIKPQI